MNVVADENIDRQIVEKLRSGRHAVVITARENELLGNFAVISSDRVRIRKI
jgi:hypothetical protein